MQFKTAVLSFFVAAAVAQSVDDIVAEIPACATKCLDDASTKAGCAVSDHTCQCQNIDAITKNGIVCVSQACSSDDTQKTAQVTTDLCLAVAQQVGGDTFSSALSSATAAAGSALTSATGAAGSAFTSATGAAGSALTSATGAAGSSTHVTSTPTPTATPAAANHAAAGMGMVGAAAMFALAL
ncbi:hypothetical protein F5Y19DRAFT_470856 [Xylariaceae sp. FL1651]|nr:hypothetical protein F5Y19DRAFT_470856 [Xylariaceae sp. FL1651]